MSHRKNKCLHFVFSQGGRCSRLCRIGSLPRAVSARSHVGVARVDPGGIHSNQDLPGVRFSKDRGLFELQKFGSAKFACADRFHRLAIHFTARCATPRSLLMRARLSRSIEYEVILVPATSNRALRIRAESLACRGSSIQVSEQARIMT